MKYFNSKNWKIFRKLEKNDVCYIKFSNGFYKEGPKYMAANILAVRFVGVAKMCTAILFLVIVNIRMLSTSSYGIQFKCFTNRQAFAVDNIIVNY